MKFEIIPHVGIGNIQLGMSRREIRAMLGEPSYTAGPSEMEFEGFYIPQPARDGYFNNELQITFNDRYEADYFEFSGRQAEHVEVFFNGIDVFHTPAPDLISEIEAATQSAYDPEGDELPYAYIFPGLDLSLWRPVVPEKDENTDEIPEDDEGKYFLTIGIGVKGYYRGH